MSKQSDKRRFVPEPVSIWLGKGEAEKEYLVTPAAWVTLFRLKDLLRSLVEEVTELWNAEILKAVQDVSAGDDTRGTQSLRELILNDRVWVLLDHLLGKPYEFFKLAIPDLDPSLFDPDNSNGATVPQVWATLETIAEVNRLDFAKNLLGATQKRPSA